MITKLAALAVVLAVVAGRVSRMRPVLDVAGVRMPAVLAAAVLLALLADAALCWWIVTRGRPGRSGLVVWRGPRLFAAAAAAPVVTVAW